MIPKIQFVNLAGEIVLEIRIDENDRSAETEIAKAFLSPARSARLILHRTAACYSSMTGERGSHYEIRRPYPHHRPWWQRMFPEQFLR